MASRGERDQAQLEMLDGMSCPHPWCDGVLKRDGSEIGCVMCSNVIVRFD